MKYDKYPIKACCGKKALVFKISKPIDKQMLTSFASIGFLEMKHFTDAGILYMNSDTVTITGPFGSNKLQIKCRKQNCDNSISELEDFIKNL